MIGNSALNNENISKQTINNRNKAIQIIMENGKVKNKAVKNILDTINEKSFEFTEIEKHILSGHINCLDLYDKLENIKKHVIPLALSLVIKNYIDFLVIEKDGEEVAISTQTILDIDKSPYRYNIILSDCLEYYRKCAEIFNAKNHNTNIFKSISDAMKSWLFELSAYTISIEKEYAGKGKVRPLNKEIIDFKNSLRNLSINPYWYVSKKLPSIFVNDIAEGLNKTKNNIDLTMQRLEKILIKDINYLFPEGLHNWRYSLPESAKNRIYKNGEERFLRICKESKENLDLEKIIFYVIGIKLEYWNEDTPLLFYKKLKTIKQTIENEKENPLKEGHKISFFKNGKCIGEKLCPALNSKDDTVNLLKKDILSIFEDYGNSINHSEKIGAMLEIAFKNGDETI